MDKLQKFFQQHGVNSTAEAITAVISVNPVQVAPPGLAESVTILALAKGTTATASTLTLVTKASKAMTWVKLKLVYSIGAAIILTSMTVALSATIFSHEQSQAEASFEFTGTSEYFIANEQGELQSTSVCKFTFIRKNSTWKLISNIPGISSASTSEIADDGTNAYTIARGASSWIPMGPDKIRTDYIDSADIWETHTYKLRHHSVGILLLLAPDCVTNADQQLGDVMGVISSANRIPYLYKRADDPTTNSFGPAMLTVFLGGETRACLQN
jgi:hypothetical protein